MQKIRYGLALDQLPPHKIWGEYEGGIPINFGNSITPLQANDTPISIRWIDDQPGRLYVLMMLGSLFYMRHFGSRVIKDDY